MHWKNRPIFFVDQGSFSIKSEAFYVEKIPWICKLRYKKMLNFFQKSFNLLVQYNLNAIINDMKNKNPA